MNDELIIWVQTQAPAGNWVDSTGFPFGADVGRTEALALTQALASADHERRTYHKMTRVIKRQYEIIG